MLEIAIMIEGQNGLTWTCWQSIVRIAFDDEGPAINRGDAALNSMLSFYGKTLEGMQPRGVVAGSSRTSRDRLSALEEAGLQRIMLQWLDLEDPGSLEALARFCESRRLACPAHNHS